MSVTGFLCGIRFLLTIANFIVLCIIWANLDSIKETYDKILKNGYSNDVNIYVKSCEYFSGPITVLCDETAWNVSLIGINSSDFDSQTLQIISGFSNDTSYCDQYVNKYFNEIVPIQEYFSLYWLTPSEEQKDVTIDYFWNWREFVYVYAIFCGVVMTLALCCIGPKQTG